MVHRHAALTACGRSVFGCYNCATIVMGGLGGTFYLILSTKEVGANHVADADDFVLRWFRDVGDKV